MSNVQIRIPGMQLRNWKITLRTELNIFQITDLTMQKMAKHWQNLQSIHAGGNSQISAPITDLGMYNGLIEST